MFKQVPFPHILSSKVEIAQGLLRIVTDVDLTSASVIIEPDGRQQNPKSGEIEPVYNVWKLTEVKENRPAKGDWTNWPKHPTYYSGTGKLVSRDFLCNLGAYSDLIPNASVSA